MKITDEMVERAYLSLPQRKGEVSRSIMRAALLAALTTPCTCREDVVCGACMSGATDPATVTGVQPTPPADDVREALAAARNVEQYLDMLALDADDRVHVVIDDGYDGDGVIQSLEVPDLRTLIAFVREVRPRGTVTDAEVEAAHGAFEEYPDYDPNTSLLDPWLHEREAIRAALEAAREAQR